MYDNALLAEALFPALASIACCGTQPSRAHGNAAGFVFGSLMVPSQTGAALDGTNGEDQPAVDGRRKAYL